MRPWPGIFYRLVTPESRNLDNHLLCSGGPIMEDEVRRILKFLKHGPFIFNLGHGVLPPTPIENVERVIDMVRSSA